VPNVPIGQMVSRPLIVVATSAALLAGPVGTGAQGPAPIQQTRHWSGQGVAPVYEGFDINPDGTFNMWFGYMNRNYEEQIDLPVGPDNKFEPGPADRGQPTHFDPRRRKDIFPVVVPKDFPQTAKLVWSLTAHGKTESVAGVLNRVWQIDRMRTTRGGNSESVDSNTPPVVDFQPATQVVAVGAAASLRISATDDGLPKRRGRDGGEPAPIGMTVEFEKYRGPGAVRFSAAKERLADGKATATAFFGAPGEYIILAVVDDGSGESAGNFGYHCCWTDSAIKVVVR
jgi:hypothetical protein